MDVSSLFSADLDALRKVGDLEGYNWLVRLALFAALLTVVFVFWAGTVNFSARQKADEIRLAELNGEGLTGILWIADAKKLAELGFGAGRNVGDLVVYQRPVEQKPAPDVDAAYPQTNIVIQRAKKTIAVADLVRVHDVAVWGLGSSDLLKLGAQNISLAAAFESPSFRQGCEPLQVPGVSIVFVGLESFPSIDSKPDGELATERANKLGQACLDYLRPRTEFKRDTTFWAVGLGRARDPAEINSPPEIRQRAAVMLMISRRQTRDETISIPRAFAAIIQTSAVSGTDLSRYSYSANAEERLRMSNIDFAGFLPPGIHARPITKTLQ